MTGLGNIVVSEYMTLDGVIESPEQWQFPFLSPDLAESIQSQMAEFDSLLLGRLTYEIFAAEWPKRTHNEFGVADKLNQMPKFVVSTTLKKVEWNNTTLIQKGLVEAVNRLRQQSNGEVAAIGSGTLVRWLMKNDLVNEIRLLVHPVVVGHGQRLFPDGIQPMGMSLVGSKTFQLGVVGLTYQPAARK